MDRTNLPVEGSTEAGGEVTEILAAVCRGDTGAQDELYKAIYGNLHRMAGAMMRGQPAGHTLQPTALVHEAYLKLIGTEGTGWANRRHFLRCAAKAMRSILVDAARARGAKKRGGGRPRITFDDRLGGEETYDPDTILSIHEALEKLDRIEPESARVVELRFFAGLGLEEAAKVMSVSRRSAYRRWDYARLWLYREISE